MDGQSKEGEEPPPSPGYTDTPATQTLRSHNVLYQEHHFDYVEKGGTNASSSALGVAEHSVVKTLVFEDNTKKPLLVLQHGDYTVDAKALAKAIGVKKVASCSPTTAERHTGYQVGGTSPFGIKSALPVYVEESIMSLDKIYINGGRRGFLVSLSPQDLVRVLSPTPIRVATKSSPSVFVPKVL